MKQIKAAQLVLATLAGFVGACTAFLLFQGTPVGAQEKIVVKAHEFLLLNQKNEPVGRLATSTSDGLPFMVFGGSEREGVSKNVAIFIGFYARVPQVRVQSRDRKDQECLPSLAC